MTLRDCPGEQGSVTTMLLCFIIPPGFYLKVQWTELRWYEKLFSAIVIVVGFAGMVVGLHNTLTSAKMESA